MREILFRGKRERYGWIYGSLISDSVNDKSPIIIAWASENSKYNTGEFSVLPDTIGQYTGIKDKNGKKIFEGDIVGAHYNPMYPEDTCLMVVTWLPEGSVGWGLKQPCCEMYDMLETSDSADLEVIGNVYDNPQMLEIDYDWKTD